MKKNLIKIITLLVFTLASLLFASCIGMGIDIQMNADGSGKLSLEYRISTMLLSLGELDGNASIPIIPVSREDFENTAGGISGMKLVSYSSRKNAEDLIISAVLEFDNMNALMGFLDPALETASITRNGQSGKLDMILWDNSKNDNYDSNSISLMKTVFSGYNFSMSFSGPRNSTMTVTDKDGNQMQVPPNVTASTSGRKTSLSVGMIDMLSMTEGLGVSFSW